MSKKLYDAVPVHGVQGVHGPVKAYACTNCMEFWAELSVAYMWREDNITEFNKWYPHNRYQLKHHDPHTFEVLHALWNPEGTQCRAECDEPILRLSVVSCGTSVIQSINSIPIHERVCNKEIILENSVMKYQHIQSLAPMKTELLEDNISEIQNININGKWYKYIKVLKIFSCRYGCVYNICLTNHHEYPLIILWNDITKTTNTHTTNQSNIRELKTLKFFPIQNSLLQYMLFVFLYMSKQNL
jgi:hypothetical protein